MNRISRAEYSSAAHSTAKVVGSAHGAALACPSDCVWSPVGQHLWIAPVTQQMSFPRIRQKEIERRHKEVGTVLIIKKENFKCDWQYDDCSDDVKGLGAETLLTAKNLLMTSTPITTGFSAPTGL